jgi:geranylgeranyl diphosphate synthase, type I
VTSPPTSDRLRSRVDRALAEFLTRQREFMSAVDAVATVPVADAVADFVLGGGKRLRPAFAYWGYRGAGGADSDELVATVSALEFVQASALMHDDVIDGSDTRRGELAVHRRFAGHHRSQRWHGDPERFGTAAAILLGDLCLVWSDELLRTGGLPPAALARARPVFDQMRTEVTLGQYLDVLTQATGDATVEQALKVARLKSAKYTVERPLQIGAALAGAPPAVVGAYTGYGLPLGEAFQLRDDVLGLFGDPALTGKPAGDDLREGKRTYLVAATLEAAGPADRERLASRLGDPKLDDAGVAELRQIITDTGALARTERRIADLTATAVAALATAPVEPVAVEALTTLATAATTRAG